MSTRFPATWWLMVSAMLAGCAAPSLRPPAPAHVPPQVRDARRDADVIPRCADRMTSASADLSRMSQSDVGRQRGFLSPPEQDAVERSFAGYLSCRNELNRIAAHYRAAAPRDASDPARAWDAELVRSATAARIHGDALLVSAVQDNPVLFRTLNQACYRSGIPRGAFDDIVYNLTDSRTLAELDEPLPSAAAPAGSPLQLASFAEDSRPGRFAVPSARNTAATKKLVDELVQRRSRLFPAATNELWHAPPTRVLVGAGSALRDGYFDAQSGLVTRIGRIKNPLTKRLMISTEQQREIHSALRSGDVLLTYTAGVASNLFVPGAFKHALTYVGTDAQRRNSGLTPEHIAMLDEPRRERLLPALRQTTLVTGEPADLVEALSEGVHFNNLERLLATRIDRLVVLRPQLNEADGVAYLMDVLSYVGDEYDFFFDFADGSDQACTEVVYRTLDGRGGIQFPLTTRLGRATLSADDILRYHLRTAPTRFQCVLVVDEDPQSAGHAQIAYGLQAEQRLAAIMGEASPSLTARGR